MNTSRFPNRKLFWAGFLLFFLALKMRLAPLFINLTYLWVNDISARGYEAVEDQRTGWQQMARFFPQTSEFQPEADATATIPGLLQGIHAFREAQWGDAAYWFSVASNNNLNQTLPDEFSVSPWAKVTSDHALVLDGNSYHWSIRADSAPNAHIEYNGNSFGLFICDKNSTDNERAAFYWNQPLSIRFHHTAILKTAVSPGTTLVFETVIDDNITRHLVYSGTGETESITIPFLGEQIDLMYILLFNDPDIISSQLCQADIQSFTLLLDEEFK